MSFEAEMLDLMPHEVTVDPWAGVGSYSPGHKFRARVEQGAKLVRDRDGREVVSQTLVLMAPTTTAGASYTPKVEDRLTLPAGFVPAQPPIINVRRVDDEDGLHHWEVAA